MIVKKADNIIVIQCTRSEAQLGKAMYEITKLLRKYEIGNTVHINQFLITDTKAKKKILITGEMRIISEENI